MWSKNSSDPPVVFKKASQPFSAFDPSFNPAHPILGDREGDSVSKPLMASLLVVMGQVFFDGVAKRCLTGKNEP